MLMRTTVTLDADTEAMLRKHMGERGVSFKQAINDAIRSGLMSEGGDVAFETPTFDMGPPVVDLDRALRLAAALEDDELVGRLRVGR